MKMTEIQKMYLRARGRWSKNAGKEEEKKKAKQFAEIRDSERAGEFGTDKLTASYCASTPGQTNEAFEPHMMYDPKTGKGYKAEKEADHLRMKKLGYTHDEPDVKEGTGKSETWEDGYKRRVVKTTDPEHKEDGYKWRIKGKEKDHLSIKLYKTKPSQSEFNMQMKRVAGHEFGG